MESDFLNLHWWECEELQWLIFLQYYCLRGIFEIGRYLKAVRRKISRVVRRFLIILTIKNENINARRNKSYSFHPSSRPSSFITLIQHVLQKECIFSTFLNLLRKCSGNALKLLACESASSYFVQFSSAHRNYIPKICVILGVITRNFFRFFKNGVFSKNQFVWKKNFFCY